MFYVVVSTCVVDWILLIMAKKGKDIRGVLPAGDARVSLCDIWSVCLSVFFYHFRVHPGTNCTYRWFILLFLHLEEQTDSGKCKNVVHKYIKFISVLRSCIFLNQFVLWMKELQNEVPSVLTISTRMYAEMIKKN